MPLSGSTINKQMALQRLPLSAKGGFRRDFRPSENVFFTICMERRHTPKLWSQIMDGKIMVRTSVSLSLTDDDLLSHSHNRIDATV